MAEDCCSFNKESFIIKPPKKSPLALRMVVLAAVMICGIYICSMCLKQIGNHGVPRIIKIELAEQPCHDLGIPPSEIPYVHYPKPTTYSREECACTPVRYFAILSMQRSGSGWFETLLNSHINISSNGEIFSVKGRRSNISAIIKTLDKVYNLDWHSSASKNECTAAVGFKWMLNQVLRRLPAEFFLSNILLYKGLMANHKKIVDYFKIRGVSAIFLFRRNQLRQMVSVLANNHDRNTKQLNGTHKAHVHSKDEAEVLGRYKPTINATSLISHLRNARKSTAKALECLNSTRRIVVYYEDLIQNRTKMVDVLDFLKVPRRKLASRHVKIHTRPLSEQVQNWDDVYHVLKGTRYENFLNADYKL